jgi:SAM-dependent methyltransferase
VTDTEELEIARYARMRWNTPLSVDHAALLLDRLDLSPGTRIADIGCGWGELLLNAVTQAGEGATGTGVDSDGPLLERGRREAARRGLDVTFTEADAAAWRETAQRVLCIGASHAFGDTNGALRALADVVEPGGRLLFGDGCWAQQPDAGAQEIFPEILYDLPGLVAACRAAGWGVIHCSTANLREWDDFESAHRAGRQEWLLANAAHPEAAGIRDWLALREQEYFGVYRGVLGLAYLVLARPLS